MYYGYRKSVASKSRVQDWIKRTKKKKKKSRAFQTGRVYVESWYGTERYASYDGRKQPIRVRKVSRIFTSKTAGRVHGIGNGPVRRNIVAEILTGKFKLNYGYHSRSYPPRRLRVLGRVFTHTHRFGVPGRSRYRDRKRR